MQQLVYSNRARDVYMPEAELLEMLQTFRRHNSSVGITGILLYGYGSFLKLIEGKSNEVGALYARIEVDPRHFDLCRLDVSLPRRLFADWSMAYAPSEWADLHLIDETPVADVLTYYGDRFAPVAA